MVKCSKCSKLVSKKSPGLQCNKCTKWIHGPCADLSAEQLTVLFATESEWKCRSCVGNVKQKRISFIMPEPEEEENTDTDPQPATSTKTIMSEIRREVREVVRSELQTVLQFYSDKIDEYETKIKLYENQCTELKNTCKNLALKNDVLEQKVNYIEQNMINNCVEIIGIDENADVQNTVKSISTKIKQNHSDIIKVYRKKASRPSGNNKPSPIIVSLAEGCRDKWLEAAKATRISSKDLGMQGDSQVYIRESLTPNNAFLLWKAKMALRNTEICRFVWCKNGIVMARRAEKEKPYAIRSIKDIEKLEHDLKK